MRSADVSAALLPAAGLGGDELQDLLAGYRARELARFALQHRHDRQRVFRHPLQGVFHVLVRPRVRRGSPRYLLELRVEPGVLGQIAQHRERHDAGQRAPFRDHVVVLVGGDPLIGELAHREPGTRIGARPVDDVADGDVFQGEADQGGRQGLRRREPAGRPGAAHREADERRREKDIGQHHENEEREDGPPDDVVFQEHQQDGDFGDALGHETRRDGERRVEPRRHRAQGRSGELPDQWDHRQRRDGQRRQLGEREVQVQPGRTEEKGHEKPVGDALEARGDVALHLMRQPRQGDAQEQRAQGAVQAEPFGAHDRDEQGAQDQAEGKVRDAQEALQIHDQQRHDPPRHHPGHHDEGGDLPQQEEHALPAQGVGVLADGHPHHQQHQQLGDERGHEQLDPDGFPQAVGVDQHLGEDAQAGQGQDPREGQRAVEIEPQPEVVEQVHGDDERGHDGNDDRDDRSREEPAAQRRHEPRDVDLVQTDDEEIEEDAEGQEDLYVAAQFDEAQNGAEEDARGHVCDDRVQPETPENALGQLGDDDEHADGE